MMQGKHLLTSHSVLDQRRAGILLHPTSLPGPYAGGDIGPSAFHFIDFLTQCGCSVWQMLPLGPTHDDGSPYQCLSVHAANPLLISIDWLVTKGWLDLDDIKEDQKTSAFRLSCLHAAGEHFRSINDHNWQQRFEAFRHQQQDWLRDYALFIAIKRANQGKAWMDWPEALRLRQARALQKTEKQYRSLIDQVEFEQFVFFTQWHELRDYANTHGVKLFGDMPIFVSLDSADVWADRHNFLLNDRGEAAFVAGVPPDAFSDEGQRWGNPLYDWSYMMADDFKWWHHRFKTQQELFDLIRIDHFRGFEAGWEIPADEDTAINGHWVKVPGDQLLKSLFNEFDSLSLVAEDLGLITDEVHQLRDQFQLPGMKVLQFAFDGDRHNIYLPYNHEFNSVVYTGTHDNDTSLGWYLSLDYNSRHHLHEYLGVSDEQVLDMPWMLNRLALASAARLAILPMQDILSLDSSHRMNIPGTTEDNWRWRFDWSQVWSSLSADLHKLVELYGRVPDSP